MMKMAPLFETMEADCRLPANQRDRGKKTSDLEIKNRSINHWPNISMKVSTLIKGYFTIMYIYRFSQYSLLFSSRCRTCK